MVDDDDVAALASVAVPDGVTNLCVFSFVSFVVVCIFRFDTVLYDFSFTNTLPSFVAGSAALALALAGGGVGVWAGAGIVRSFAFLYSSRIST